jgi:hypothetical protein
MKRGLGRDEPAWLGQHSSTSDHPLGPPHAGPDSPPFIAMVRRSIKRVAGGADIIRIKFFWLLSPELRWLGQPGNGNLTVCDVMVDVLSEQLVSGSV